MKYKAIFFDIDDTLLDFRKTSRKALSEVMITFKIPASKKNYAVYDELNHKIWKELEKGLISQKDLRSERFRRFFKFINHDEDPVKAGQLYMEWLSEIVIYVDEALDVLEKMKHLAMVIITNGIAYVQNKRYKKASLSRYFRGIVISEDYGLSKPDPRLFKPAFTLVPEASAEEILMIGDSLSSDIQGANNAGIDSCWFNPGLKENNTRAKPDYVITRLSELQEII